MNALLFAAVLATTSLFNHYEGVRQALLKGSVADVQRSAKALADAAQAEKQPTIAGRARDVASAATLNAARISFAALSDEMIRYREGRSGDRPVVAYCSMEKKSWLQPNGAIANPYVDGAMRACGEIKAR
jgi:hypothetical protein